MNLNIIKNTGFILLSALVFVACTPKDVTVYQQEDELLNCRKLTGKIAELIHTNGEINQNTGLEKTSIVLWVIHPIAGAVNQINASKGRDNIDSRFQYLLELKEKQNCVFTDKERAFAKLQGKGRFSENMEQLSINAEKYNKEMESR
jgi:hypothetical protein